MSRFLTARETLALLAGGIWWLCLLAWPSPAWSGPWDATISNTRWYVPQENLLAYSSLVAPHSSFLNPPPAVTWDQTLWNLGVAQDGAFTGVASATFLIPPLDPQTSSNSILGLVTPGGQIRMQFTSTQNGGTTIGIGQFRMVNGIYAMEMQMITGRSQGLLVTHWAYMLPYDPQSFLPPDPLPNTDLVSNEWAWTRNTRWSLNSPALFGPGGRGQFRVLDYRNGYFWGSGSGPSGSPEADFTHLGSITPEGNVLFNLLDQSGNLISLTGHIAGGPQKAHMTLRGYDFSGNQPVFGSLSSATLVPEPAATWLALTAVGLLALATTCPCVPRSLRPIR